jgi:NhaP-type Na+/H+ or K+/H+ antiporter
MILIIALVISKLFEKIKLPSILGMILTGMLLGPFVRDKLIQLYSIKNEWIINNLFISQSLLDISSELRLFALVVILIRAGLGLNKKTLQKIGISALKMSFIPGVIEGIFIIVSSMFLLKFSFFEAGMLAFIIAAVSPAIIVPSMIDLKEKKYGQKNEVPSLILAGASIDDVFAITIFSIFLGLSLGNSSNIFSSIFEIPFSIVLGIIVGGIIGLFLTYFFKKYNIRDTFKILIFISSSLALHELEKIIPIASLIGIMSMGFIFMNRNNVKGQKLSRRFEKIWAVAQFLLFILIGAAVNLNEINKSILTGISIVLIGLIGRSVGVFLSLLKSNLDLKERLFCIFAYIPKATVQAAIGAIPLSFALESGNIILSIAVLSILLTAPLGVVAIKSLAPVLLKKE